MNKHIVSIVRYEKPLESVAKAVDLSHGLDSLPSQTKVFIKPNIVLLSIDLSPDDSFHKLQPPQLDKVDLALQILEAGIKIAGDTPLALINEPIFISAG